MYDILDFGQFSSDEEVVAMIEGYCAVILPTDGECCLTHWWKLIHEGEPTLYLGTPETFKQWTKEESN